MIAEYFRPIGEEAQFALDETVDELKATVAGTAFHGAAEALPELGLEPATFLALATGSLGMEAGNRMPGIINAAVVVGGRATVGAEARHVIVQFPLSPADFESQVAAGDLEPTIGITLATNREELIAAMAEERAHWVRA